MSNYLEKLRDAEEIIAGEIVEDHLNEFTEHERTHAAILLGRAQAVDRVAVALSAEVIRFLEHFEKSKLYRALGHRDFVTFISNSGLHDVTKNRYYDRKKLLDKEGDPVFDALTIAGVPMSVRGQLAAGDVGIDGENIIVKGDDDSEDLVIHKDDHRAIVQALKNQANTRRTASKEAAALREKLKAADAKHGEEKRELYEEIDRVKAAKAAEIGKDPHSMALANLCFAFAALRDEIANLTVVDCEARCSNTLEILAGQMSLTSRAYGGSGDWAAEVAGSNGDQAGDNDDLLQMLADVDLSRTPGDNDAELAASM